MEHSVSGELYIILFYFSLFVYTLRIDFKEIAIIFFQPSGFRSRDTIFTPYIRRVHRWCAHLFRKRDR